MRQMIYQLALTTFFLWGAKECQAQNSAFTYQGRLNLNGAITSGFYDFSFGLFRGSNGEAQVGTRINTTNVFVSNGLFVLNLTFGDEAFDGSERWLEISVRTNGALNHVILSPRQPLTSVPHAMYAVNAHSAASISGSGSINSSNLATGSALANLLDSGQSGVPSGGLILSLTDTNPFFANAGYTKLGTIHTGNSWQKRRSLEGLEARHAHTAVWSGTEMLVWGGFKSADDVVQQSNTALNSGGRFNPSSKLWNFISTNNAPRARGGHSSVWTDREMIIWGGHNEILFTDGGRYDPNSDSWSGIPTNDAPAGRYNPTTVWSGKEMIIWGGSTTLEDSWLSATNSGSRFIPSSNKWFSTSLIGAPTPRVGHTAVWTGSKMIIWGGENESGFLKSGGIYDPRTDTWTPMAENVGQAPRRSHSAVWTGTEMMISAGIGDALYKSTWLYNPNSDAWTLANFDSAPVERDSQTAIWAADALLLWGGFTDGTFYPNSGGVYAPSTDTWVAFTTDTAPVGRYRHTAIWTGLEMIIHGGKGSGIVFGDTWSYVPPSLKYLYVRP